MHTNKIHNYQKGFSLLELLVTLGVIAVVSVVAAQSKLGSTKTKKEAFNTSTELQNELANTKNYSLNRNTTSKISIQSSAGVYTMTISTSSTPTTSCSSSGTWNTVTTRTIPVNNTYEITGSAITDDVCFYRDGSSTGGTYVISPITTTSGMPTFTFTITVATGYVDVVQS